MDFRLLFHTTEEYDADKDKYDIRVLATVRNI